MNTKTKLSIGITFLFILIIGMGGASIYFIRIMARDSRAIIKDNEQSLDYVQHMHLDMDTLQESAFAPKDMAFLKKYLANLGQYLDSESADITEPGEKEAVVLLRRYVSDYSIWLGALYTGVKTNMHLINQDYANVKYSLNVIYKLNQEAILRKNQLAARSASNAVFYISLIGTIFFLVAFVFIINFPGYIADPIRNLSNKIRAIADGDFSQRLEVDPRGDEFGLVANSFNYLARKLLEFKASNVAEITTQKTRIESIVNSLDEAIILLDENQTVIAANPVATELLGMKSEDIVGQKSEIVAKKNDLFRAMAANPENPGSIKEPMRIIFNGQENYFQKFVHPIFHFDEWKQLSNPAGYVIVLKNITEFKTLDIAKTNFMANLSHELKAPLSSISQNLKLIGEEKSGKLTPEQAQSVDNIRLESNRLAQYVNELLDLSQIETWNIKLNISQNAPADIVFRSVYSVKPILEQNRIRLETNVPENLPMINCDSEKTLLVMSNLLNNAARSTPAGGAVYVSAEHWGGVVRFKVRDEGPGIDSRYHEKIFERFVQVYGTDNKGGTGLGLAIARDFIEAQGGKIWVESALGEGNTFIFELPIV